MANQAAWNAPNVLHPFSDILMAHERLTCNIHERCDLTCDPNSPPVVTAVDFPARMPDNEDGSSVDPDMMELVYSLAPSVPQPLYEPERSYPQTVEKSLEWFAYKPLLFSGRHIRLLKIRPAVFLADVLDCELVDVSIDAEPIFDALSYSWGSSVELRSVLVNGKQHIIQSSLDEALRRYRRLGGTLSNPHWRGKAEYVWADGLCINQTNLEEKMEQVTLMYDIYRRARRVFIDLGPVIDHWITALELMQVIRRLRPFLPSMTNAEDLFKIHGLPDLNHIAWLAFGHLFEQAWFRRTWIVQEMAVPQRHPIAMFGRFSFDLGLLFEASGFIAHHGYLAAINAHTIQRQHGYINTTKLTRIRNLFQSRQLPCILVVELLRDFLATDPRDKIYGILSLLAPEDRLLPDYTASLEDVYTAFAVRRVELGDGGRLLDSASLQRRLPDTSLPTWIPDWRAQRIQPRVISSIRQYPYSASKNLAPDFSCVRREEQPMQLKASIILIDRIDQLGDIFESTLPDAEFFEVVRRFQELIQSSEVNCNARYSDLSDALSRTLLMDDLYEASHNTILMFSEIRDPAAILKSILSDVSMLQADTLNGIRDAVGTFQTQSRTTCTDRRLAVTNKGFMGLVPRDTQPLDAVAVFPGAPVPHVLRSTGDEKQYELVGDAYVHGIMYGEAISLPDSKFEDILLN